MTDDKPEKNAEEDQEGPKDLASLIDEDGIDTSLPPFVVKMLRQGYTVEPIRLDRNGRWWHRGNIIDHPRIARLFHKNIGRTEGGTWVLEVGRFTYPIEVDDTPLFVRSWTAEENATLKLVLNTGETRTANLDQLAFDDHGLLFKTERGFWARFEKAPYMRFAEKHIQPEGDGFAVVVGNEHQTLTRR